MKRYYCKICGAYSGKRKTCLACKEEIPFEPSRANDAPFHRKQIYDNKKAKA